MRNFNIVRPFAIFRGCLFLILPISMSAINLGFSHLTVRHETIRIIDKDRVNHGDNSYYLVWTENNGVLTVRDDWFQFKFSASDTYGQLREEKKYKVKVNGIRLGLTSSYPNILEITDVISTR